MSYSPPSQRRSARAATITAFFLDGVALATWVTRIPEIQERLHLRNVTLGFALLMMSVGALLTMRLMGRLVATRGSRFGLALAVLMFGAGLPLPAMAGGVVSLSLALMAYGTGFGAMNVAANAQAVSVERLYGKPIMASFHATFSLGGIVGAILGSAAVKLHVPPLPHFLFVGVPVIVAGMSIGPFLVPDVGPAPSATRHPPRTAHLLFLGAIAFCTSLGEGSMADWSAVFLRQVSKATESHAALGFAAFSVAMTLGRFVADRLTSALGPVRIVRLAGVLSAAGLLLAMLLPGTVTAVAGFALVGLGLSAMIPTVFSAASRTPGVAPSVSIAKVAAVGYFGFLCGPPVIGFVSDLLTLRWAVGLVFVACCVAAALAPHVGIRPHPAEAAPPGTGAGRLVSA